MAIRSWASFHSAQPTVLLAREAGAVVFDGDGSEHTTASRYTLAAVPRLRDKLLGCVAGLSNFYQP